MKPSSRKLALVVLIAAFTASVSGYFMGMRQTGSSASGTLVEMADSEGGGADAYLPQAPLYAAMAKREHQPNHGWKTRLSDLPSAPAAQDSSLPLTPEEQAQLRQVRASRRAYDGAPPTVPHAIDQHHSASCMACHGKPTRVGDISVPQISHPSYTNCLQCHAAGKGPSPAWKAPPPSKATPTLDNQFAGLEAPSGGSTAYEGAPPILPHSIWMRQNCLSCHGPGGSSAIKPDHAARQNCLQCHATNSSVEQRPLLLTPAKIPVPPLPGLLHEAGLPSLQ